MTAMADEPYFSDTQCFTGHAEIPMSSGRTYVQGANVSTPAYENAGRITTMPSHL